MHILNSLAHHPVYIETQATIVFKRVQQAQMDKKQVTTTLP